MQGSVLDELKTAFRQVKKHEPKLEELLDWLDVPFDGQLLRGYREAFGALDDAYNRLGRARAGQSAKQLDDAVDAYWKWLLGLKDAMSVFRLLAWWRQDRVDTKHRATSPSSVTEDAAYILAVVRLFLLAVQKYDANAALRGFTRDEWTFVRTPLAQSRYHATYDRLFEHAFKSPQEIVKQTEAFLRLHGAGHRYGATLATDEELLTVLTGLLKSDPKELYSRSFTARGPNQRDRQTVFKIGETIGNDVYIVYFDAKQPTVYVNFAKMGDVVYSVAPGKFVEFADTAEYQLIYELTQGILVLVPLLFDVLMAVPGIVSGGMAGLVEACLQPFEAKAAEEVMEALGIDPDGANWVVLGINILAHRLRPGEAEPAAVTDEPSLSTRANTTRGIDDPIGGDDLVQTRATTPPDRGLPETTARATSELEVPGAGADAPGTTSAGRAEPKRAPSKRSKAPKADEAAEHRAKPVSAKKPSSKKKGAGRRQGEQDPESGKGTTRSEEQDTTRSNEEVGGVIETDATRATTPAARAVPEASAPEIAPPRVRSAQARVVRELEEERAKVARVKQSMSQKDWAKSRAGATKRLYDILELRAVLKRVALFPRRVYLEQAEVIGVRVGKTELEFTKQIAAAKARSLPDPFKATGRIADFLELNGTQATLHDLKSPSTLQESVGGGMSSVDFEAEFRTKSEIGRQHAIEEAVIEYAQRSGGKVVVRGKDPINGAAIEVELDPSSIRSSVSDYNDVGN